MSAPGAAVAPPPPSAAAEVVTDPVHQPYLDGFRAVAVYLVLLFHAGIGRFAGGYIGVDVFFVLSGFLVTRLLVRDLAGGGAIRFGRFYSRRFRRLLPASFVALIGTAFIMVAVDPARAVASIGAFKAAFLYSANWYFIRESTAYFGDEVARSPVLQFWSLAVEEQFYLVWPVLLAGLFGLADRLRRHQLHVVRLIVAAGAVASLAWALHLRTGDPNRAYYGTDARAYQLLAGASLALVPGLVASLGRWRRTSRVLSVVAIAGIVVAGTSVGGEDPIRRGVAATVLTAVAIVALEGDAGGWATRALSSAPVVHLGRVSYGTYLWHWPVVLIALEALELDPTAAAAVTAVVATGLASLSYQLLEQPVRQSPLLGRHRFAVIGAGLAISVISALVVIPAIIEPGSTSVDPLGDPAAEGFTPIPDAIDVGAIYAAGFGEARDEDGDDLRCVDQPVDRCTIVRGSGPHVLLLGDSHAQMMTNALIEVAEANDLTLSVVATGGCPWQRGLYRLSPEIQERCRVVKEDAYSRVIPELDPDLIIAMNSNDVRDRGPTDPDGRPEDEGVARVTAASVAELTADGRQLVVIEPFQRSPDPDFEPLHCIRTAEFVEDCRYVASTDPSWYELQLRELDSTDDRFLSADLDRLVCPYLPICDPIVGGVVVKWDRQHLTAAFSRTLGPPLASYLREHGLIPP